MMARIRRWRNDQTEVLRQIGPIWRNEQLDYYQNVVVPDFRKPNPDQILLGLVRDGESVAYGGLTHIDWVAGRAELSFLAAPKRAQEPAVYRADFLPFLAMVVRGTAFEDLELRRVWHESYDIPSRELHVAILEGFGFALEERRGGQIDSLIHGIARP